MKKTQIITVTGRSNSGKTTLVEKLIREFNDQGMKISSIKSIRHDFDIDHPGKDSFRHKNAGAHSSAITNGKVFAVVSDNEEKLTPVDLAEKYFNDSDLVIIEGYKEGNTVKIEVIGDSKEEPLFLSGVDNIRAIVTDKDITAELPVFKRNDASGVAAWIGEMIGIRH